METSLERIYKSALLLSANHSIETTYELVVNEAMKLVHGRFGSLVLKDKEEFQRVFATSNKVFSFKTRKRGYVYKAIKQNKPRIISRKQLEDAHPGTDYTQVETCMIIPLSYQKKAIGAITIFSAKNKPLTRENLHILQSFGPFATLSIKNAQLLQETKNALETRDFFISMASHELKTPVTTINVYMQLIRRKILKQETINVKWIDPLLNEITRLTKLINELLQVNQVKTGELFYDWKQCSLKEIIGRAIVDFQLTHPQHSILYHDGLTDEEDYIWADYDKILQVIMNILGNAAKFSEENSQIILTTKVKNSEIIISIRDRGKGISEKDLKHIFERFYRGNNKYKQGMGLGLFLSKQVVDSHKGSIYVHSKVNEGSVFEITLPRMK